MKRGGPSISCSVARKKVGQPTRKEVGHPLVATLHEKRQVTRHENQKSRRLRRLELYTTHTTLCNLLYGATQVLKPCTKTKDSPPIIEAWHENPRIGCGQNPGQPYEADHPCVETWVDPLAYLPLLLNWRCLLNESLYLINRSERKLINKKGRNFKLCRRGSS